MRNFRVNANASVRDVMREHQTRTEWMMGVDRGPSWSVRNCVYVNAAYITMVHYCIPVGCVVLGRRSIQCAFNAHRVAQNLQMKNI